MGSVVDSLDWHTEKFNTMTGEAEAMQKGELQRANVVFVVFNDVSFVLTFLYFLFVLLFCYYFLIYFRFVFFFF